MLKKSFALLILLASLFGQQAFSADIIVNDPWVREAPPTAKALAAYATLNNHGKEDRAIVSAKCKDFGKVELHLSKMEGGMMKMIKQDKVTLPKGKEFQLKPGSYHIMLMNPKRKLVAGDKVDITLVFDDGKEMMKTFTVRKATGKPMHNMEHHIENHDRDDNHDHDMKHDRHDDNHHRH